MAEEREWVYQGPFKSTPLQCGLGAFLQNYVTKLSPMPRFKIVAWTNDSQSKIIIFFPETSPPPKKISSPTEEIIISWTFLRGVILR